MFFFKSKAQKVKNKTAAKKKAVSFEDLDEKQKILLMIRKM